MTVEEVVELGGSISENSTSGCTDEKAFINTQNYWLGSAYSGYGVWFVHGERGFLRHGFFNGDYYGVRPVIEVLKSSIE